MKFSEQGGHALFPFCILVSFDEGENGELLLLRPPILGMRD